MAAQTWTTSRTQNNAVAENLVQYIGWMEAILASTPDPILVLSAHFDLLRINDNGRNLFALPQDIPSCTLQQLLQQAGVSSEHILTIQALLERKERCTYDLTLGQRHYVLRANALCDVQSGWVCVLHDQTEHDQAELHAIELALERERIHGLRQFLTDFSHDFRTPLSIIATNAYFLEKLDDPQARQPRVRELEEQIQKLTRLIELGLDTAQHANGLTYGFYPLNLNDLLNELRPEFEQTAQEKNLTLRYLLEARLVMLMAQREELGVALKELIKNALYFTPKGGHISIATQLEGEYVVCVVTDTGIGIAKQDLHKLFRPFFRTDRARGVDTGGSGLGLSVVKRIMDYHGGQINVNSVLGEGTQFRLTFPRLVTT